MQTVITQTQLEKICENLHQCNKISIDTEFAKNRKNNFFPKISLIQVSYYIKKIQQFVIIDCLSSKIKNYTSLKNILQNEKIMKIFHASSNDLPILEYYFNCKISNIFDTQHAYSMINKAKNPVSYKFLIEKFIRTTIDKSLQNTNWMKRPLTNDMLKYAKLDVEYLQFLQEKLTEILKSCKKYEYFLEDMQNLDKLHKTKAYFIYKRLPLQNYTSIKKTRATILYNAREKIAKITNINPENLISDSDIVKFIKIEDIQEIKEKLPDLANYIDGNWNKINELLIQIDHELFLEYYKIKNDIIEFIRKLATQYNISQFIVISREEIKLLAKIVIKKLPLDKYNLSLLSGWRFELFGKKILKLLNI